MTTIVSTGLNIFSEILLYLKIGVGFLVEKLFANRKIKILRLSVNTIRGSAEFDGLVYRYMKTQ